MAIRTIRAPGVELTEIDKSEYTPSMVGTTVLVTGFASKGESYEPTTITSKASFINYFGEPKNEAERYFYAACNEVLAQNGNLIACKLPYDNESTDQFRYAMYSVNPVVKEIAKKSTETLINAYTNNFSPDRYYDATAYRVLTFTELAKDEKFVNELKEYVLSIGSLTPENKEAIINATTLDDTFYNILIALDVNHIPGVNPVNIAEIETVKGKPADFEPEKYFPTDVADLIKRSTDEELVVTGIVSQYSKDEYGIASALSDDNIVGVKLKAGEDDKVFVKKIKFDTKDSNVSTVYSIHDFSNITDVILPNATQFIASKAFKNDSSLNNITFGTNTKYIGSNVFNDAAKNGIALGLYENTLSSGNTLSTEANTFFNTIFDSSNTPIDSVQSKITGLRIYTNNTTLSTESKISSFIDNLYINIRKVNPNSSAPVSGDFDTVKFFSKENSEMLKNISSVYIVMPPIDNNPISATYNAEVKQYNTNGFYAGNFIESYAAYCNAKDFSDEILRANFHTMDSFDISATNPVINSSNIMDYCLFDINSTGGITDNIEDLYGFNYPEYRNDLLPSDPSYPGGNTAYITAVSSDNIPESACMDITTNFIRLIHGMQFGAILSSLYEGADSSEVYHGLLDIFPAELSLSFDTKLTELYNMFDRGVNGIPLTGFIFKQTPYGLRLVPALNPQDTQKYNLINKAAEFFVKSFAYVRKEYRESYNSKLDLTETHNITVGVLKDGFPNVSFNPDEDQPSESGTKKLYPIVKDEILGKMSIDDIVSIFENVVNHLSDSSLISNEQAIRSAYRDLCNSLVNSGFVSNITNVDESIDTYQEIQYKCDSTMNLEVLDLYVTGEKSPNQGEILIFDKLGGQYAKTSSSKKECLGIIPIVTTAANALFVQGLIEPTGASVKCFEAVSEIVVGSDSIPADELVIQCESDNISETTVSKLAARYFPPIAFSDLDKFDREHFKKIGVVILRAYVDSSISNKVNFEILESFVGSLDKDAVDPATGVSTFIDTIVNNESEYVYLFSNVPATTSEIYVVTENEGKTKPAASLGWKLVQMEKQISIDKSISKGLEIVFQKNEDIHEKSIDIVLDAGISNIAQYISKVCSGKGIYDPTGVDSTQFALRNNNDKIAWLNVLRKYNEFCSKTRRDCMFIADGLRPICLRGSKKVVRPSKPTNTIDNSILPNLKYLTGMNTNYGAGYMDWFEIADDFSGEPFWCPPSIQACGCYIFTDINYNFWDAPAGQKRGNIAALDVAFSPSIRQAGEIYDKSWNYAINYADVGLILEGQKTLQLKKSAFDRVNVRRLFLRLERQVYHLCRQFVYEPNNVFTRQCLVDRLEPIFSAVKSAGGIYDYKIICDETINTPEVIDNNELRVKIGIKPTKTAEFILVQFYALRTNGSWDEMDISYSL